MTSVCNTNMRPLWCQKNESIGKMKTKKRVLCLLSIWMCTLGAAFANGAPEERAPGERKGDAIITIFSDAHSGFGTVNHDRGFNLDRAYIGYQYALPHGLQLKAVLDFGQSKDVNDYQRIGYVKNAQITWKQNGWTLNAGLITTTQFKVQEDFWGKRYVMKSFQDEYKFGSSADLGVSVAYKFNKVVSADVIVANGEGYKKVQVKDGLQYGAGVTLTPVEGLTVRAYGSYNESVEEGEKGITNLAAFVGYKHTAFSVAAEYNYQTNMKYVPDCDQDGFSVYASAQLSKKISLFGRWDLLSSEKDWNKDADGMAGMVGAEFKLGKYIKLAPNFRLWSPKTEGGKTASYVYLNASFAI